MALTITKTKDPSTSAERFVAGDHRFVMGALTFDNSYNAGGESITAAELGFDKRIDEIIVNASEGGSRLAVFDKVNSKIKLFTGFGVEAVGASDQSTITVRFIAIGE